MTKKSNRQALIDSIMSKKYGSDDPKYDESNHAFLESLTLDELEKLNSEFEDEFDLEGEVRDSDFDDEELYY